MGTVICLEDLVATMRAILERLRNVFAEQQVRDVRFEPVPYRDRHGVPRSEFDVASDVHRLVDQESPSVLVVDLAVHPWSQDIGYGLRVVREYAKMRTPGSTMAEFLCEQNCLTFVYTNFQLTEASIREAWGENLGWKLAANLDDVREVIDNHERLPLIAKVHKSVNDPIFAQLAAEWIKRWNRLYGDRRLNLGP